MIIPREILPLKVHASTARNHTLVLLGATLRTLTHTSRVYVDDHLVSVTACLALEVVHRHSITLSGDQ